MNLQTNKKGVIVLGGHVQGLGIIRIFGKNNIPCVLLDSTGINIARHSKYCKVKGRKKGRIFQLSGCFCITCDFTSKRSGWHSCRFNGSN